ncbi:MAG: hypothetical protein GY941_06580 [Planctomycetes bacterium]|nr:hypothetical protein [Planctomycetota bacterium]
MPILGYGCYYKIRLGLPDLSFRRGNSPDKLTRAELAVSLSDKYMECIDRVDAIKKPGNTVTALKKREYIVR